MNRWIRWEYLVPRLLGAIVAVLVVQYLMGVAIRHVVVSGGEGFVGAKVELAHTRVGLLGGTIELHDLRVANPLAPLQNLLQFDYASLDIEAHSLLHKRAVVRSGRISGLRFGSARETSGALTTGEGTAGAVAWLGAKSAEQAEIWLAQLSNRFENDVFAELESVRLTESLLTRWPKQQKSLETRVQQLKQRGAAIQSTYVEAQANPLRHFTFLRKLPKEIVAIQKEFASLVSEIEKLPELVDADRRAIIAARKHDEQFLRDYFHVDDIDSGLLVAYFLQDQLNGPVGELIAWTRWARDVCGGEPELRHANRGIGQDVLFDGVEQSPDLLIRSLEVRGAAQFADRPLALCGTLRNLSSDPALQNQPTKIYLMATGDADWRFEATIDRRSGWNHDKLVFDAAKVPLAASAWGRPDQLRFEVAPGNASIRALLRVDDKRLVGNIQFAQKSLRLTPQFGAAMQSVPLGPTLKESIADIDALHVRVAFTGTIDKPQCELKTGFGERLADAFSQAVRQAVEHHSAAILARARQHVDQRLASLERQIAQQEVELVDPLRASVDALEKIVSDHKASAELSVERVGRQLPEGSLFR